MKQERNTGINQLGIASEIVAGAFIASGIILNGNLQDLMIGGTLASAPIAGDFVVKVKEARKNRKELEK